MNKIEWPKILLRSLGFGNLAILFGAGATYDLGFPLWGELIDKIYQDLKPSMSSNQQKEIEEFIKIKDYLEAVEYFIGHSEEKFYDIMQSSFSRDDFDEDAISNSNESLLLKLNAHSYLTTNIDNSLEYAKGTVGKKSANIYCYNKEEDIKDMLILHDNEKNPLIIRLHGELSDKNSLIFSRGQYDKLLAKNYYVFEKIFPALLLTSATIIVGYSLSDPDIQMVLERIYETKGKWSHIFFFNTDGSLSEYKKSKLKTRYGIEIIDLFNYFSESETQTDILKKSLIDLNNLKDKISSLSSNEKKEIFSKTQNEINREIRSME